MCKWALSIQYRSVNPHEMRCEYQNRTCTKSPTHQLNIAHRDHGGQHVHYYCEPHALMKISEAEDDDSIEILSADEWSNAKTRGDD